MSLLWTLSNAPTDTNVCSAWKVLSREEPDTVCSLHAHACQLASCSVVLSSQINTREYSSQAPDDRNTSSPDNQEVIAAGRSGAGTGARSSSARIVNRMTQLEAGIETKLSAFLQWAGPMMLTAIGLAPSECMCTPFVPVILFEFVL